MTDVVSSFMILYVYVCWRIRIRRKIAIRAVYKTKVATTPALILQRDIDASCFWTE